MAADARPAALALWAPILVICHQRHTLLLPRAVLAHHQDGHDDDIMVVVVARILVAMYMLATCTFFWLPSRRMMKTLVTVAVIHLHHTNRGGRWGWRG